MGWYGLTWLRIGTDGELLWTFGFHKMLGSSWVAAELVVLQEGPSSMSKQVRCGESGKCQMWTHLRYHNVMIQSLAKLMDPTASWREIRHWMKYFQKQSAYANILNEQLRIADNNWPSMLGSGQALITPRCKEKVASYEMLWRVSDLDGFLQNVKCGQS
jgi:hypothetical protein